MAPHPGRGPSPAEIAATIEAEIRAGERPPGSQLRSRSEMAADFGVGETTIFSAVQRLKARGMLRGEQGRGLFVAPSDRWVILPPEP